MALNNFDEFIDKTDFLQTRLLQVNSCGSERVVKYDYTILRSNGRRDYHFLYLQNGWLDIEVGTAKARLSRGQCAVFLPNVRQMYSFTAAGEPISLYLHFTGQAAAEAMQYLRPTQSMIYTISDQTLFESLFHRLNRERGKTIVLITHNRELALETDRFVTMRDGRLYVGDSGEEVRYGDR